MILEALLNLQCCLRDMHQGLGYFDYLGTSAAASLTKGEAERGASMVDDPSLAWGAEQSLKAGQRALGGLIVKHVLRARP